MTARSNELEADNAKLRATLERTRGALEEREFLIRRLERSESNNANVLGRIQTSIERLGVRARTGAGAPGARVDGADWLGRIDRDRWATRRKSVRPLGARAPAIGRASGCELQIDSASVSRHHALAPQGPRDIIIEDLNSTNGVYRQRPQGRAPGAQRRRHR